MIVFATELEKALRDVERAVISSDVDGLKSCASSWRLPGELSSAVLSVSLGLIRFSPKPRAGRFIVFSGVDKSGKETHCFNTGRVGGIISAYDHLTSSGFRVLPIRQPAYDTLLGSLVGAHLGRRVPGLEVRDRVKEEFAWILWSLDRAQFNEEVARWLSLTSENVVLAKRWTESHAVYQPEVGVSYERVMSFERNVVKQDVTIVLDVPFETALSRLHRRLHADNYEKASLMARVRERYLSLPMIYPYGEVYLVDASRSLAEVNRDVLSLLDELLRKGKG